MALAEASKHLTNGLDPTRKIKILNQIKNILSLVLRPEQITDLITGVTLTKGRVQKQLRHLNSRIQSIPQDERESVLMYVQNLVKVIKVFKNIPVEYHGMVLVEASKHLTGGLEPTNTIKIPKRIKNILPQVLELEQITNLIAPITQEKGSVQARLRRIKYDIQSIPHDERKSVLMYVQNLVMDEWGLDDVVDIIVRKGRYEADGRAFPVDKTLVADCIASYTHAEILEAVIKVNPADRTSVVENTLRLITGTRGTHDHIRMLNAVAQIDPADRASVVENTLQLITGKMGTAERTKVFKAVAMIDPADRESVVVHTLLIENRVKYGESRQILRKIADLPIDQRTSVVETSLPIINQMAANDFYGVGCHLVLEAIHKIPQNKRGSLVLHALPFTKDMNGPEVTVILDFVNHIPETDPALVTAREIFRTMALSLQRYPGVYEHRERFREVVKTMLPQLFQEQYATRVACHLL